MVAERPDNADTSWMPSLELAPPLAEIALSARLVRRGSGAMKQDPTSASENQVKTDLAERIAQAQAKERELTERELAERKLAEGELVERYGRGLRCLLLRITGGDVELAADLYQDTILLVIKKLRSSDIKDPEKLAGFMCGIARNLLTGEIRKNVRRATNPDSDYIATVAGGSFDPFEQVSKEQVSGIVMEVLGELTMERDRLLIRMFYLHEIEKTVICNVLEISTEHFNRVIFRAKGRLRELMEKADKKYKLNIVK